MYVIEDRKILEDPLDPVWSSAPDPVFNLKAALHLQNLCALHEIVTKREGFLRVHKSTNEGASK
jgi:hypothetical protein